MRNVILLLISLIMSLFMQASADTTYSGLYKRSQLVAHVRITYTSIEQSPAANQSLGSTWYKSHFKVIGVFKQTIVSFDSTFAFIYHGHSLPDSLFILPGKDYLVFLHTETDTSGDDHLNSKKTDMGLLLLNGGLVPFTATLGKKMNSFARSTAFDRAVSSGKWNKVERKIRRKGLKAARKYGKETGLSMTYLYTWIGSHYTVDKMVEDCYAHISIYPGWQDKGIRFITSKGPTDFVLTYSLGKVTAWKYWFRWAGFNGTKDRIYYKNFTKAPRYFEEAYRSCK